MKTSDAPPDSAALDSWAAFANAARGLATAGAGILGVRGADEWPPRYKRWTAG